MQLKRGLLLPRWPHVLIALAVVGGVYLWKEQQRAVQLEGDAARSPERQARMLREIEELVASGSAGVPGLAAATRDHDPYRRRLAIVGLGRIGRPARAALEVIESALDDHEPLVRRHALRSYLQVSEPSPSVARRIAHSLGDPEPEVRDAAADSLAALGELAVVPALDLLHNSSVESRRRTLQFLITIRSLEQSGVITAAIRGAAHDPDSEVRVLALTELAQADAATIGELRELLHSVFSLVPERGVGRAGSPVVPGEILGVIANRGADAAELVPDLVALLAAWRNAPRTSAEPYRLEQLTQLVQAVGRLGRAAQPAVRLLRSILPEVPDREQLIVAEALVDIGPGSAELTELLAGLWRQHRQAGSSTVRATGRLLVRASPSVARVEAGTLVQEIREAGSQQDVMSALDALHGLAAVADEAVPLLLERARSQNRIEYHKAIVVLGEIGPPAAPVVPQLILRLQNLEPYLFSVITALGKIGPAAREAVPVLLEIVDNPEQFRRLHQLRHPAVSLRASALVALQHIRVATPEVLDCLTRCLDDDREETLIATLNALADIEPDAEKLQQQLAGLLCSPREELRKQAALVVGRKQILSPEILARLSDLLQDTRWELRHAALQSLMNFGPRATAALPVLYSLRNRIQLPGAGSTPISEAPVFRRQLDSAGIAAAPERQFEKLLSLVIRRIESPALSPSAAP